MRPFAEREIDVMFSGTYTSSNKYLQDELESHEQKIAYLL